MFLYRMSFNQMGVLGTYVLALVLGGGFLWVVYVIAEDLGNTSLVFGVAGFVLVLIASFLSDSSSVSNGSGFE